MKSIATSLCRLVGRPSVGGYCFIDVGSFERSRCVSAFVRLFACAAVRSARAFTVRPDNHRVGFRLLVPPSSIVRHELAKHQQRRSQHSIKSAVRFQLFRWHLNAMKIPAGSPCQQVRKSQQNEPGPTQLARMSKRRCAAVHPCRKRAARARGALFQTRFVHVRSPHEARNLKVLARRVTHRSNPSCF